MPIDPTNIVSAAKEIIKSGPVAGSVSETWAAIIGDRIANWRLVNAAKLQLKVQEEFKKLGLKPNTDKIPERYAITWFEEASKQDEAEIQDLFARLLARAAAGDHDALDRRNVDIVAKLTPNDAILFLEMAAGGWWARRNGSTLYWEEKAQFMARGPTQVDIENFNRSFEHLLAIGILTRVTKSEDKLNSRSLTGGPRIQTLVSNVIVLTETGRSLFEAVKEIDPETKQAKSN